MNISCGIFSYRKRRENLTVKLEQSMETEDFSLTITDSSEKGGSRISVILTPKTSFTITECSFLTDIVFKNRDTVFLNGFQTWTESREASTGCTIPKLSLLLRPIMGMYGDYSFYRHGRNRLQSWTYTYIRNTSGGPITFWGSLSEDSGYTIFEYNKRKKNMRVLKDCKGLVPQTGVPYVLFDLFCVQADENTAFENYFAESGIPKPKAHPCTGWTSWYNYYTAVTQTDVLENLAAMSSRKLPIDIFQIDDGYQEAVGDWLSINKKFPQGMDYLAVEIHKAGYKAGLWLAPIICEKRSRIYKEHPDWVIARAGFNPGWSGIFYALDFYNPEVRDYLREVFDTVLNKWNYDMVKLDFLYAASLAPRKDKTRGQIMSEFFKFLRDLAGDKIILGCGVPLGCAFGLFDYCRVSSDVALSWEDTLLSKLHYRERTSTINALTSTIGRYQLNGRAFYNDPDVFILRDKNNKLTDDQKYTLFMINSVLGGLVFTSDNVSEYTDSQMDLFKTLFTLKNKKVIAVEKDSVLYIRFSAGAKTYCLISNLTSGKAVADCPYDGILQQENRTVCNKERIEMRPCQTVCIQLDMPSECHENNS